MMMICTAAIGGKLMYNANAALSVTNVDLRVASVSIEVNGNTSTDFSGRSQALYRYNK